MLQLSLSQCSNTAPTIMKSQSQQSHQPRSFHGESRRTAPAAGFPVTDYQYLGKTAEFRGREPGLKLATPARTSPFHQLSYDFIGSEMKRDYFAEAAFFAVIVAVSAWPIVSMIRAIADLAK